MKFNFSRPTRFQIGTLAFAMRHRAIVAGLLLCLLLLPQRALSERTEDHDTLVVQELSALGTHGDRIARAREQVLDILQHENACAAWFEEANPDAAEVFRSLHFELENGPSRAYTMIDSGGTQLVKEPWGAKSFEYGGRDSTILLNANGAFFNRTSELLAMDARGTLPRPIGKRMLAVSSYSGNTPEAQITILLHELGHVTGRLPEDDDSWDRRSSRNTSELLRHCKAETRAAAQDRSRRNN